MLEGGRCPHMERLDVDLDIAQERSEKQSGNLCLYILHASFMAFYYW